MKTHVLGWILLFTALITTLWAILFIYTSATSPAVNTLADQVTIIENQGFLFILNYLNAGLLTLAFSASLAGLYLYCRDSQPLWATLALVFIPVYAVCNLIAYLSQVFVVPGLLEMYHNPQTSSSAEILLRLAIHTWPGSITEFINGLAYAVMGIPAIILGLIMFKGTVRLRSGSLFFASGGLLPIIALLGIGLANPLLKLLSPLGGLLALVGLVLLGRQFLRHPGIESTSAPPNPAT